MPRIIATLRRRIERAGRLREAAFEAGDMVTWKRAADRGAKLRDALITALSA